MSRLAIAMLAVALASRAGAATFTVDRSDDQVDVTPGNGVCAVAGGGCTLRAAIQEGNALAGIDSIVLPIGTYDLTRTGSGEDAAATGDLDVTRSTTIIGDGADTTIIDASALQDRVFDLHGDEALIEISDVAIRGGTVAANGGGINSAANLTLNQCVITSNHTTSNGSEGGGIYATGPVAMTACTVEANSTSGSNSDGGGIAFSGTGIGRTLLRSAVIRNSAARHGGGIHSSGGLTALDSCTVSGNNADGDGGGMRISGGMAQLIHVTVARNTADHEADGDGEGGGLRRSGGSVTIRNSILAENIDNSGTADDCSGTITLDEADNLVESRIGCTLVIQGMTTTYPGPALLGPLEDNGGSTLTHALQLGSKAIDAARRCFLPRDQRGLPRPVDGDGDTVARCDLGAYELDLAAPTLTPATPTFTAGLATASPSSTGATTATQLPTGTATATSTAVATTTGAVTPTIAPEATPTASPTLMPHCAGDCSGNARTSVDEIVLMVNIALERATLDACRVADASGNGTVTVDEIVAAVNAALLGCAT